MNVACILGSPRKGGNSTLMAQRFTDMAASLGAQVTTFRLNELDYRGCQHCLACKKRSERCVLDDGLTPALAAVEAADVILLATPVYYGDVSGQMKLFIDRTYGFLKPDYPVNPEPIRLDTRKAWVFVISQGHPDESLFADIFPRYAHFLQWFGFKNVRSIRACGLFKLGDAANRPEVLAEAEALARELVSGTGQ